MTTLIIGHPNSGKSAIAERIVTEETPGMGTRIYMATMIPYGEEGAARVQKHRKMRRGKGFATIEAPFDINKALDESLPDWIKPSECIVLLECVSNYAANELFERKRSFADAERIVVSEIKELSNRVGELVIVSNRFEDDGTFDSETKIYAGLMDKINAQLETIADRKLFL